ncbi:MAG: DUF4405 domain-containing protein [Lachnospiraceae bacterium]|nr:DUF4405 domain-containing protein [Lachnospiraceae bacterium]
MKYRKIIIDVCMTLLLPVLMAYSLIGETFHEVAGSLMFVLFILHHWMNRQWFKSLFRGRYTLERLFRTLLNVLLTIIMMLLPLSGIAMSKHLYTSLPIKAHTGTARMLHLSLAYWGLVLMSLHAGTHLDMMQAALKKKKKQPSKPAQGVLLTGVAGIGVYGCYALVKRQIPSYLFLQSLFVFFDYGEQLWFFFLDYLAVMLLFAELGYLIAKVLRVLSQKSS